MTAKGDRAASGVQVITYIVIFEMIMQMYLLCKNTSHTLPLISAVHCRFYFNSKVYLQSEDSGSHRRKFQHRCLVCSDNRIPTPLPAVSSVMSKHSLPLPRVGQHLGPKESSGSALHGLQPLLTAHKTNHLFHAFLHAIVLSLKALCDLSSTDIFV